ncbi:MAG TPA: SPOR domain-containing protein [Bacteroidales bacterium]|nr:SPOR domain-containing protein [Bacteroidales bacterium]
MKKYTIRIASVLLIFLFPIFNVHSQVSSGGEKDIFSRIEKNEPGNGNVVISQDLRINHLISNHIKQNNRKRGVPGYRIRIFNDIGSDARENSQKVKASFFDKFPEIPIYREYDNPYFKVYVGDFRTKIDAMKEFKRIKHHFPAAFIVPDEINYPSLEE